MKQEGRSGSQCPAADLAENAVMGNRLPNSRKVDVNPMGTKDIGTDQSVYVKNCPPVDPACMGHMPSAFAVFAVGVLCTSTGGGTSTFVRHAERMKLPKDGRSHRRHYRAGAGYT
jgi:hypothetical protein